MRDLALFLSESWSGFGCMWTFSLSWSKTEVLFLRGDKWSWTRFRVRVFFLFTCWEQRDNQRKVESESCFSPRGYHTHTHTVTLAGLTGKHICLCAQRFCWVSIRKCDDTSCILETSVDFRTASRLFRSVSDVVLRFLWTNTQLHVYKTHTVRETAELPASFQPIRVLIIFNISPETHL